MTRFGFLGFFWLLAAGSFSQGSFPQENIQGAHISSPVECINILTKLSDDQTQLLQPEAEIELFRDLKSSFSEASLFLQSIWDESKESRTEYFLAKIPSAKLTKNQRESIGGLQALSYQAVVKRFIYQRALLDFLASTEGDLARISHVHSRYEDRRQNLDRGSYSVLFSLAERHERALEYSTDLFHIVEKTKEGYYESCRKIEVYLVDHPDLRALADNSVRFGIPNSALLQQMMQSDLEHFASEYNVSFQQAAMMRLTQALKHYDNLISMRTDMNEKMNTTSQMLNIINSGSGRSSHSLSFWSQVKHLYYSGFLFSRTQITFTELNIHFLNRVITQEWTDQLKKEEDELLFHYLKDSEAERDPPPLSRVQPISNDGHSQQYY